MLDAAQEIRRLLEGRAREDLDDDRAFRFAIERALEIIGVAASRVSDQTRTAHTEIEWQPIVSLRNVIAHQYGDIILDQIWLVVTDRVPELIDALEPLVERDD
jgi:uncharacterized protein with HEPN domain